MYRTIKDNILSDLTINKENIIIYGIINVVNGVTLKIEKCHVIFSDEEPSMIIVNSGAQIIVDATTFRYFGSIDNNVHSNGGCVVICGSLKSDKTEYGGCKIISDDQVTSRVNILTNCKFDCMGNSKHKLASVVFYNLKSSEIIFSQCNVDKTDYVGIEIINTYLSILDLHINCISGIAIVLTDDSHLLVSKNFYISAPVCIKSKRKTNITSCSICILGGTKININSNIFIKPSSNAIQLKMKGKLKKIGTTQCKNTTSINRSSSKLDLYDGYYDTKVISMNLKKQSRVDIIYKYCFI